MTPPATLPAKTHPLRRLALAGTAWAAACLALPAVAQTAPAEAPAATALQPLPPVDAAPVPGAAAVGAAAEPTDVAAQEPAEAAEHAWPHYRNVGEATHNLLALQRGGHVASPVPRPVPGEVAQRSRERYLKSFEREIPERFQSSVAHKPAGR